LYKSKTLKWIIISILIIALALATTLPIIYVYLGFYSHFNISLSKYCIYKPEGITVDSSGNIYVIGSSKPYGEEYSDVLLLKYNSYGNLLWNRTWDRSQGGSDIMVDSIGNIYITGGTNKKLLLLKYNFSGYLQWGTTWDLSSSNDWGKRIVMDHLGNIYIMGSTRENRDIILLKCYSNGSLQWYEILGDPNVYLHGEGITTDGLGNVYITGTNQSSTGNHSSNTFTLKYNSFGDLQWKRVWGGSGYETSNAIVSDSSGNIYVTGGTTSYTSNTQSYILKYNATGELQWYKIYIANNPYIAPPYDIELDTLGNIYTISYTHVLNDTEDTDIFLSKYDSSGNGLWNKTWEKPGTEEYVNRIELDNSGNIYISSTVFNRTKDGYNSDILLLKYNSSGDLQWNSIWGDLNTDPRCK